MKNLMSHVKDLGLASASAGTFGTVAMWLAPYTDHTLYEAVLVLVHVGDIELK